MIIDNIADGGKSILVIGAHQDDAEFSCGRLIIRRGGNNTSAIYMTDGRKGQVGKAKVSEDEHAKERQAESIKAMSELGVPPDKLVFLGLPDQDLISYPYIIDKLFVLIKKMNPEYVLIPPWEGAHPDHDAVHLFSIIALQNLKFDRRRIVEYASYNNFDGISKVQQFIPSENQEERLVPTVQEQEKWKRAMGYFASQPSLQESYVPASKDEGYRLLPRYDYSRLPYSTKVSEIVRGLMQPVYPLARKVIPKRYKMYYETWDNDVNPNKVLGKLSGYKEDYKL